MCGECPIRVASRSSELYHLTGSYRVSNRHYVDSIYGRFTTTMGPQIEGAARGKLTFPRLINDPVCHVAVISKAPFWIFFKKKETKLVFNARKLSVGVGDTPYLRTCPETLYSYV